MAQGEDLGALEQKVLAAVLALNGRAYSRPVSELLIKVTRRTAIDYATVHITLVRLENKGYLASRWGEHDTGRRGARPTRYFDMTERGREVLKKSWRISDRLRRMTR